MRALNSMSVRSIKSMSKIFALRAWAIVLLFLVAMQLFGNDEEEEGDAVVTLLRQPSHRFFMYSGPGFDHAHLLECMPQWDEAGSSQHNAELWMHRQLLRHPARTNNASSATIFVVPIFLHISYMAGQSPNRN